MQLARYIAHRGASQQAPENTLVAIRKASELGAQWIEFDVQLTADNELVIFHDDDLQRTSNGQGAVSELTLAEIKSLDAGSWFAAEFAGEKIPTLKELLLLAAELKLGVNIELKPPKGKTQELISALLACIKSYWPDDLPLPLLSSFDWDCLTALKNVQASYPIGLLMHEWKSAWLAKATELSCATVNVNQEILTVERVAAINEAGYPLLSYTVNSKQRAQELFNWGVAGVFTDAIDQLQTEEGNS